MGAGSSVGGGDLEGGLHAYDKRSDVRALTETEQQLFTAFDPRGNKSGSSAREKDFLMCEELLKSHDEGGELCIATMVNKRNGWTPLHYATSIHGQFPRLFHLVLERTLVVDARTWRGKSPLHIACMFADAEAAECLCSHGASLSIVDCTGLSPAQLLASTGERDLLRKLQAVPCRRSTPGPGNKPMKLDSGFAHVELPPLMRLIKDGRYVDAARVIADDREAKCMIEKERNPRNQWTVMHLAAAKGAAEGGQKVVDAILSLDPGKASLWVNVATPDGLTPLQVACTFSDELTAAKLIAFGANFTAGSPSGFDILLKNNEKGMAKRLEGLTPGQGLAASGGGFHGTTLSFLNALESQIAETAKLPSAKSSTGDRSKVGLRKRPGLQYMLDSKDSDLKEIDYVSGGAFTNLCV